MANKKGHTVLIRHGVFHYYSPERQVINGEDKEVLVERMAFHNQEVELSRDTDYERGQRLGAFWTRPEAIAHYEGLGIPAPLLTQSAAMPQPAALQPGAESESDESVELTDLDEDELVDWILSTGQFDGEKKPTVAEVVEAGTEGGPEFAERLHKAEVRASGDAPRQGVVDGLTQAQSAA